MTITITNILDTLTIQANAHEAFVAMHQGAKMIAMLTMFGE